MPTLILLRHAKSDYPPGVADAGRPLSERGLRDAAAARDWIATRFPRIDEARVSPARRARMTWEIAGEGLGVTEEVEDPRIYDDWGAGLADVMADVRAEAETAIIVGHNPGIEEFAASLAPGGDPASLARMRLKYPTSGIAIIDFEGDWASPRAGSLREFGVPRG